MPREGVEWVVLTSANAVRRAAGLDRLRILPADPQTGLGADDRACPANPMLGNAPALSQEKTKQDDHRRPEDGAERVVQQKSRIRHAR